MLAAEESRRLEENLMRLEMRRVMMGQQQHNGGNGNNGIGGSISGNNGANEQGNMGGNHQNQYSRNASSGMNNSQNDDSLMARAQRFNVPQNQISNMVNNNMNQFMGGAGFNNWNNNMSMGMNNGMGNNHPLGSNNNFNNNQPSFTPLKSVDGKGEDKTKSSGDAVGKQASSSPGQSTVAKGGTVKTKRLKARADAPRRPLSAYNIFFSLHRETILNDESHGVTAETTDTKNEDGAETPIEANKKDDTKNETTNELPEGFDLEAFTHNLMTRRLTKNPTKRVHRKSHGKVAFTTLVRAVGKRWRGMPEEQKKKYNDLADIDRTRYKEEKALAGKVSREEAKKQRKEAKEAKAKQHWDGC